jgi:phasin family protein
MSAAKTKAAPAAKQIEDAVAVSKAAIDTVVKAGSEAAGKGYEQAVAMTKEQVEAAVKAGTVVFKGYEDVVQFGKDNLDAFVKSSTIVAKGWQDLSKSVFGLAQESVEDAVAASKALLGAKTIKELIDVQSGLAKTSFDKMVAESSRLSEVGVKLAEQAIAPINTRVTAAVEKLVKSAA